MLSGLGYEVDGLGHLTGSIYLHDSLFTSTSPDDLIDVYDLLYGSGDSFSLGISYYGVSVSWVNGGFAFGFDPYSFALQVGIMILSDMFSCTQDEGVLAMMKDQGLCHKVGSWCSMELDFFIGSICIEKTSSYCCFNSTLSLLVNQQGRPQLGKGWGGEENPNCRGFLPDEFEQLDFSAMDLTRFYREIKSKVPSTSSVQSKNQQIIQQKIEDYYE